MALNERIDDIQYRILKAISPGPPNCCSGWAGGGKRRLEILLGDDFFAGIKGKVVLDFGCGEGTDVIEIAERGAKRAIGIDIREDVLQEARRKAFSAGCQNVGFSVSPTGELADCVVSVDAFEHFDNPAEILRVIDTLLLPEGEVLVSFGPTWYHPLGGHLFSVFPWAHLLFSERALIRWRSTFKNDGATRFCEVAGGLNQMTIERFEDLIAHSPLQLARLELVPIKKMRYFHNRFTREWTTAVVRCRLIKRR
jgi:SAM-dependent methyltransferase